MNRIIFVFLILFPSFASSQTELSIVRIEGDNIYISSKIDRKHHINYWFRKCMANDLFTFYRVAISSNTEDTIIVNESISDNIGPFEIKDGGWCGGNHLFKDEKTKTAETTSVIFFSNDIPIYSRDTIFTTQNIKIEVKNNIFNPLSAITKDNVINFNDTLCIENIAYTIIGNSIQVDLSHNYINRIPVTISKYYGMQSMFRDENHILTPSGKYSSWIDIHKIDRFQKKDYPRFNRFIERNNSYFQSSFILGEGLGSHNEVQGEDVIFIGNSWTKSYHKLIGNSPRVSGNNDSWSGVYSWGAIPIIDNDSAFAYNGFINGKKTIFFNSFKKGNYSIPISGKYSNDEMIIIEKSLGSNVVREGNFIYFCCKIPGSIIISFND